MVEKITECLNCGIDITYKQQISNYRYKYCSYACFQDIRFGKTTLEKIIKEREYLCLEAMKLLEQGLTPIEAAEIVKIDKYKLIAWLNRRVAEKVKSEFSKKSCRYCGTSLDEIPNFKKRNYCSVSCIVKSRYHQTPLNNPNPLWRHEKDIFENSLKMYWNGMGAVAIRSY